MKNKRTIIMKNMARLSLVLWVLSLILFILLNYFGYLTSETPQSAPTLFKLWENISRYNLLFGIIFYMIFFVASLLPFDETKYKQVVKNIVFFVLGVGIVLIGLLLTKPVVSIFGSDGSIDVNVYQEPPTVESTSNSFQRGDGLINCNFPHSGTVRLPPGSCSLATDCQFEGDVWKVYPSVEACNEAQNREVIGCRLPESGTVKMPRGDCLIAFDCEIGKEWYVYTSESKCEDDQEEYWDNYYASSGSTNYIPPEINYYSGDEAYAAMEPWAFQFSDQTRDLEWEAEAISECREDATRLYEELIAKCTQQISTWYHDADPGGSCVESNGREYQRQLSACDSMFN